MRGICINCGTQTDGVASEPKHIRITGQYLCQCPNCNEWDLLFVDEPMLEVIYNLNKVGIKTLSSCAGHWFNLKKPIYQDDVPFHGMIALIKTDESKDFFENLIEVLSKEWSVSIEDAVCPPLPDIPDYALPFSGERLVFRFIFKSELTFTEFLIAQANFFNEINNQIKKWKNNEN